MESMYSQSVVLLKTGCTTAASLTKSAEHQIPSSSPNINIAPPPVRNYNRINRLNYYPLHRRYLVYGLRNCRSRLRAYMQALLGASVTSTAGMCGRVWGVCGGFTGAVSGRVRALLRAPWELLHAPHTPTTAPTYPGNSSRTCP
jgi:hypothetical protein